MLSALEHVAGRGARGGYRICFPQRDLFVADLYVQSEGYYKGQRSNRLRRVYFACRLRVKDSMILKDRQTDSQTDMWRRGLAILVTSPPPLPPPWAPPASVLWQEK